jgi:hypothetical protein
VGGIGNVLGDNMKMLLIAVCFAVTAFAQITVNVPALTVSADGTAALYAWMLNQQGTTTFLSLDSSASDKSITVEDSAGINASANSALLIGGEVVSVTAKAGKVLTIEHAQLGTQARAHKGRITDKDGTIINAGDLVTVLKYSTPAKAMRQWIIDKMAELMAAGGYPSAQEAAVTAAKATKDAAISEAVR